MFWRLKRSFGIYLFWLRSHALSESWIKLAGVFRQASQRRAAVSRWRKYILDKCLSYNLAVCMVLFKVSKLNWWVIEDDWQSGRLRLWKKSTNFKLTDPWFHIHTTNTCITIYYQHHKLFCTLKNCLQACRIKLTHRHELLEMPCLFIHHTGQCLVVKHAWSAYTDWIWSDTSHALEILFNLIYTWPFGAKTIVIRFKEEWKALILLRL